MTTTELNIKIAKQVVEISKHLHDCVIKATDPDLIAEREFWNNAIITCFYGITKAIF
jgi:hypothetical protein